MNHCTCPLLLLSLFVWHAQRFIRAVDPNQIRSICSYINSLGLLGWGQKGPKTTLPYIMFVKITCRCKKVLGCDRSCPERRSTSYTPTPTVCGKLVCYWYIYVPGTVYTQLQTNRQYRYISMCFKFIIFKLRFSYIFRASTCMYCLNCS